MLGRLTRLGDFLRDRRGATSVMTIAALPVIVGAMAMAVDYARVGVARNDLQQAVDAAALALANAQVLEKMRPDSDANRFIEAHLREDSSITLGDITVLQREGGYAKVTAEATQKTAMLGAVGFSTLTLSATSVAQFDEPTDIDIFVLLDNSPSMLLGATQADMDGIEIVNQRHGERNCAFACHYQGRDSYTDAHAEGWRTRLDAAKEATLRAVELGRDAADASDAEVWFEIKTFTSGYHNETYGKAFSVLTSGAIDKITPIKQPNKDIYEQSDLEYALEKATKDIGQARKAHSDRRSFMIFITDGVVDAKRGRRVIEPLDPDWCDPIKAMGVRIGVIYTTYFPLENNSFWRSNVKPFDHEIQPNLEACASPGWFFEAQYGEDIEQAFTKLMQFALPKPRITD